MTDQWQKEYSAIMETHDSRVKSGELKLEEFDSAEELFSYLSKQ